jgi:hypothetical protein
MRAVAGIAGLLPAGCATVPPAPPTADAAPAVVIARPSAADHNATFAKIGRSYSDILAAENPVRATELGPAARGRGLHAAALQRRGAGARFAAGEVRPRADLRPADRPGRHVEAIRPRGPKVASQKCP